MVYSNFLSTLIINLFKNKSTSIMFRSNLIWIREQSKFKILDKKKERKNL